jgi:Eukaryotic aspartyl protease
MTYQWQPSSTYFPHTCSNLRLQSGTGGYIIGPTNVVAQFYSLLPESAEIPNEPGFYQFACDPANLPSIGFQLGGKNFMMNPADFIRENSQDGTCLGAIVGEDVPDDNLEQPVWILGNLFMKNFLTIFDLGGPTVGFGQLKQVDKQYGGYTEIPNFQRTQLGTGPSASLSATFIPPQPYGMWCHCLSVLIEGSTTVEITAYNVQLVQGTGGVSVDAIGLARQTGIPTPKGDQILATSNVPYTEPNPGPTPSLGTFPPLPSLTSSRRSSNDQHRRSRTRRLRGNANGIGIIIPPKKQLIDNLISMEFIICRDFWIFGLCDRHVLIISSFILIPFIEVVHRNWRNRASRLEFGTLSVEHYPLDVVIFIS